MQRNPWKYIALVLGLLLIAVLLFERRLPTARADSGRYDYIQVVSAGFLYNGVQGLLLLDKRNGNVWFVPKGNDTKASFKDPVFVIRVPFDKLDDVPR